MSEEFDHFVYFIRAANGIGPIKIGCSWRPEDRLKNLMSWIGFTTNPRQRLSALRTSTHSRLTLLGVVPGTKEDERELHLLLSPWNVAREWFQPCRAMQPLIDALWQTVLDRDDLTTVGGILKMLGGPSKAAEKLGISNPSVVMNWRQRQSIPATRVFDVERLTGIPAHELRPDIFRKKTGAAA